ncbi:MAG TPA: ammonium transporter [Thermotogota bacterium]|nr:ammonium transporter [Thermotogota bacterium]HPJ90268.1 ammonium transporter [Thermotogota bacterium]HPR97066.1 ammonium transporter [Thermotogota bacterium]
MNGISFGDTGFILISAAMVCLMTPGLAFFYGGLVRKKNVLTIMMQSFISMGIVTLIWVIGGFSLAFGKDIGGVIGNLDFAFLKGVGMEPNPTYGPTIPFLAFFIYQEMFAVITPALITGAFADRVNFKSYLKFLVFWSILIYIPVCHWVWGGGFLQQMGFADFAGGTVVHTTAGMAALVSVLIVGKRKLFGDSTEPHNIAFVALGSGLLWFGWFGFNGGDALAANGIAATAFVNTDIAGSIAMVTWLIISWIREKKPSVVGVLTGAVAGLATITPCAGYVRPWSAVLIGFAAGLVCYIAVQIKNKYNFDDALDVWGVHGVGGILGSILLGVFATTKVNSIGGLVEGNFKQFGVQLLGVAIIAVYTFAVSYALLKIMDKIHPVRVSEDIEKDGLDVALHGENAYKL